ncbi:hypothetical protein PMAYCL1PPCAC_17040, partial [Pristionchus mayeri]
SHADCNCLTWTISILALAVVYTVIQYRKSSKIKAHYAARTKVALRERDQSIEWARKETMLVSEDERKKIEAMDFRQLRDALQAGDVTAESVLQVYCGLAVKSHEKTNCITKIIKEALSDARELDQKAKDHSYKKPPLFGIPLSVKEQIELAGHRNTWGLAKQIDNIPKEDSYQVMKLREEGMIPFCQTNIPVTCMTYTCNNSIYGTSTNPHNSRRTCGGSSGGEGALLGSGGSICGLGSDLGGSVRIPAAYCGCCAFKPSPTRCSTAQIPFAIPMRPIITLTEGPMAQDSYAIVEMMRAMWSDTYISNKDPLTVPIDFREELFKEGKKFRIGYYDTDGYIDPLPGNRRVVREAVDLLKSKGHDLVPFSLGDIAAESCRGVFAIALADGGAKVLDRLKNEPLARMMMPLKLVLYVPMIFGKVAGWIMKLYGDSPTADFFMCPSKNASDVQAGIDKIYDCRKNLCQKMKENDIDLLLCPTTLSPAPPHSLPTTTPMTAMHSTMIWNAMDFPAGVVTTGSWTEKDETELESYPAHGILERALKKRCKNSVGLPLSVQIVAPSFRDELVLRVMVDLHEAMKERGDAV